MLFFLFLDLPMDAVDDSKVETQYSSTDFCATNTLSVRSHQTLNMSNRTCIYTTNLAPQDICLEIRIDIDIQKRFLGLEKGNIILRFV